MLVRELLVYRRFLLLPQGDLCVLAMQSVFDESLPRPSVGAVRGEMMPSCWVLQAVRHAGQEATRVTYLLQVRLRSTTATSSAQIIPESPLSLLKVDLGTPSFPQRLLSSVVRKQAAVVADLDVFLSSRLDTSPMST